MNKFKLILKGILLWITFIVATLFVLGIDTIYDKGYFLYTLITCVILCYTCYKTISEEEFKILTFNKMFNNILNED